MNKYFPLYIGLLGLFLACSEPTIIGADLLSDEDLLIEFTDTVSLSGKSVGIDSINTANTTTWMIGRLDDPIFGISESKLFVNSGFGNSIPDFTNAELDSIVLVLPLSEDGKYGSPDAIHSIEVFQLDEEYGVFLENAGGSELYSNVEIPYTKSVGRTDYKVGYKDTLQIYNPEVDSLEIAVPQLRVKLDDSFGQQFIDDNDLIFSDSVYRSAVKGFAIVSNPSESAMIGLSSSLDRKLAFYYTKQDTNSFVYEFDLGGLRYMSFNQDNSGTVIEQALGKLNQEELYIQSMAGVDLELDLSNIKNFEDKIINQATIELFIKEDVSFDIFPASTNVIASYKDEEDVLNVIEDVSIAINPISNLEPQFGGFVETDEGLNVQKYAFNVTNHVVSLLNGEFGDNFDLTITSLFKRERPSRSIIHGFDGTDFEPKLKLIITNP